MGKLNFQFTQDERGEFLRRCHRRYDALERNESGLMCRIGGRRCLLPCLFLVKETWYSCNCLMLGFDI